MMSTKVMTKAEMVEMAQELEAAARQKSAEAWENWQAAEMWEKKAWENWKSADTDAATDAAWVVAVEAAVATDAAKKAWMAAVEAAVATDAAKAAWVAAVEASATWSEKDTRAAEVAQVMRLRDHVTLEGLG